MANPTNRFVIELTAVQAKVVFNTLDGAADAGACEGGCTAQEAAALGQVMTKLLAKRDRWLNVQLDPG